MNSENWENRLNAKLNKLTTDAYPASDLWLKIIPKLVKRQKATFGNILKLFLINRPVLAACSCLLILGAVLSTLYFFRPYINGRNQLPPEFEVLQEFADAGKKYEKARQSLLDSIKKSGIPAKETEKIENSLKQIDNAISEIKIIIIKYPNNMSNRTYLADLYKQETVFLNKVKSNIKSINN